ncbi:hypothetical protein ABW11_11495 [Pluralibacter gergoviae]|nr:hypothetical protein A8H26_04470 [Pluralibacter gergoviae]KMK04220.1 hypothetical protein ABW08_11490 [Pluralibacter gergoviae]KMK27926.1 hypothetical protein ABW11_11495 [Pluralibacter gergoviae]KMK28934.1 hypothetical protein ABW12_23230 [Pluralibacter gergoviae]
MKTACIPPDFLIRRHLGNRGGIKDNHIGKIAFADEAAADYRTLSARCQVRKVCRGQATLLPPQLAPFEQPSGLPGMMS